MGVGLVPGNIKSYLHICKKWGMSTPCSEIFSKYYVKCCSLQVNKKYWLLINSIFYFVIAACLCGIVSWNTSVASKTRSSSTLAVESVSLKIFWSYSSKIAFLWNTTFYCIPSFCANWTIIACYWNTAVCCLGNSSV